MWHDSVWTFYSNVENKTIFANALIRKKLKSKPNNEKIYVDLLKNVANDFDGYKQCGNNLVENEIITVAYEGNNESGFIL